MWKLRDLLEVESLKHYFLITPDGRHSFDWLDGWLISLQLNGSMERFEVGRCDKEDIGNLVLDYLKYQARELYERHFADKLKEKDELKIEVIIHCGEKYNRFFGYSVSGFKQPPRIF